jgi:hypothetical protein
MKSALIRFYEAGKASFQDGDDVAGNVGKCSWFREIGFVIRPGNSTRKSCLKVIGPNILLGKRVRVFLFATPCCSEKDRRFGRTHTLQFRVEE